MKRHIEALWHQDEGAVTVDWVVLTAAIVGLTISVMALFVSASGTPEEAYGTNMDAAQTFVGSLRN